VSHVVRTSALIATASALALGAVLPALAQDPTPATPPAPPATQAAPPAAPAAPAAPDGSATPAAPAAPGAEVQPPQAAAEPPPPAPTLPTSGDAAVITTLLTNVCEPLVRGGQVDQIAKANGLKLDKKSQTYVLPLTPKTPYQVMLEQPGVNKNVCTLRVQYSPSGDSEKQIRDGLNVWRFLHTPQMFLHRNEQGASVTGQTATTITWDNRANIAEDGKMYGLIFRQVRNPDGSLINRNFDQGIVQYTIRSANG
jgi:hypothetical protein